MEERQIQVLLVNDPQLLIDREIAFEFNEVEGRAVLIDGIAAGSPWFVFKFLDGQYKDKTIACVANKIYDVDDAAEFWYSTNVEDQEFFFNLRKEDFPLAEDVVGDYIEELDETRLTIKKGTA